MNLSLCIGDINQGLKALVGPQEIISNSRFINKLSATTINPFLESIWAS